MDAAKLSTVSTLRVGVLVGLGGVVGVGTVAVGAGATGAGVSRALAPMGSAMGSRSLSSSSCALQAMLKASRAPPTDSRSDAGIIIASFGDETIG